MNPDVLDVQSIPVLPELASRVLKMALEDDVSIVKLASLIEKDQVLTARTLSVANSSYYRRSRRIYTVRDAIVAMGMETVRVIVLGMCVLDMFPQIKASKLNYKAFWKHSIACAVYARAMMEAIDTTLKEKAFFAGLLHDIGKLVLNQTMTDAYGNVLDKAMDVSKPLLDFEQEILGINHAEVGRSALSQWKLPEIYGESVGCHHAPMKVIDDDQYRISGVVHIADAITHMNCIGASGNNFPQKITEPLLKRFGLGFDTMDDLMNRVPGDIETICADIGLDMPHEGLFRLANKAGMKLSSLAVQLREQIVVADIENRRSSILIRLLEVLNDSTKFADALGKGAEVLLDVGLIKGFLGGLKLKGSNLVYEVTEEKSGRFLQVGEEQLKGMFLSGNYPYGASLPTGVFVYLDIKDDELINDQGFLNAVIGAMSSALMRIYSEDVRAKGEAALRKALSSASMEKQKAEDMLGLNKELINASPVGLCLIDSNGLVVVENRISSEIRASVGIDKRDIIKVVKDSGSIPKKLRDALSSRAEVDISWEIDSKTFRFITKPVKINKWLLVVMWDITKDIENQKSMLAYAKMSIIGNLAASMAHNMKSPLGAIQGFARMIKDDMGGGNIRVLRGDKEDEDFPGMIDSVVTGTENVLDIVNRLLSLARRWEGPVEDVDLAYLLDNIFNLLESQAKTSGVILKKELYCTSVHVKAQALEQVIINLVMNAITASASGQEVVVRASRAEDEGVMISVSDSGVGMDDKQISRVFEPLYTNWPAKTGMGLGLSLAEDIIDTMGGRIRVESKPGKGSTFFVSVPEG
ncbi:MAG: HDOD domain-containing protein [Thermodesulfobacteriota bacterium]|nr:HDOD domain-containing protein [Thermodesulfobacteriota bacterium]